MQNKFYSKLNYVDIHKMYKSSLTIKNITFLSLCLTILTIFIIRIWALNKGFNITDEAYAVLGYEPLQERLEVVSVFHRIVVFLIGWLQPSLITYRIIGQLLTIIAVTFFAYAFCYWVDKFYKPKKRPFESSFIVLLFILGGFVLDYDKHSVLNYDVINNALNLFQAGIVLILIGKEKNIQYWQQKLGWSIVAFLTAFQFLNKATSAIAFTASLVILLVLYRRKVNWQYYLNTAGFFILGGAIGLLSYFVLFQDFGQYQELLFRQLPYSLARDYDNDVANNLWAIAFIRENFKLLFLGVVILGTSFAIFRSYFLLDRSKDRKKVRLFNIFICVSSIVSLSIATALLKLQLIQFFNITKFYPLLLVLFFVNLIAAHSSKKIRFNNQETAIKIIAVSLFLFFLPFVAAIGTNTSMRALAARNIVPWLALIVIFLTLLYQTNKANNFLYLFTLGIILWLGIKIAYTQIYQPFRLVENRLQQTESVEDYVQPKARGLKVDPPTANFLKQLHEIIATTEFQPGDPIIALHDMPGLVYLLGGVSPGAPWYFSDYRQDNDDGMLRTSMRTCNNILHSNFDSSKAILIVNSDISPQVLGCMKDAGVNFPEEYQKVGELNNPFRTILPFVKYSRETIEVWSPK